MWFPGYASAVSFGLCALLHNCNPRYGWLVRPYPTGTSTLQETPSLLGAQRPRAKPWNCTRTPTGTALTCTVLTRTAPAVRCRCGVRAACTVPHTVPVSYREAHVCKCGGRAHRPNPVPAVLGRCVLRERQCMCAQN